MKGHGAAFSSCCFCLDVSLLLLFVFFFFVLCQSFGHLFLNQWRHAHNCSSYWCSGRVLLWGFLTNNQPIITSVLILLVLFSVFLINICLIPHATSIFFIYLFIFGFSLRPYRNKSSSPRKSVRPASSVPSCLPPEPNKGVCLFCCRWGGVLRRLRAVIQQRTLLPSAPHSEKANSRRGNRCNGRGRRGGGTSMWGVAGYSETRGNLSLPEEPRQTGCVLGVGWGNREAQERGRRVQREGPRSHADVKCKQIVLHLLFFSFLCSSLPVASWGDTQEPSSSRVGAGGELAAQFVSPEKA